jgi:hypothetical protein
MQAHQEYDPVLAALAQPGEAVTDARVPVPDARGGEADSVRVAGARGVRERGGGERGGAGVTRAVVVAAVRLGLGGGEGSGIVPLIVLLRAVRAVLLTQKAVQARRLEEPVLQPQLAAGVADGVTVGLVQEVGMVGDDVLVDPRVGVLVGVRFLESVVRRRLVARRAGSAGRAWRGSA